MSNQSEIVSTYIQALEQNDIFVAINYAMFALLLYDYLLNFSREVDLIWHQKFRPLSFLYILNYYPRILNWLLATILNSYTPHCTAIYQFSNWSGLLSTLVNTAFQITRTYAIWGQSWIVASSLVLLSLPLISLDFWGVSVDTCTNYATSASYQKYNTIGSIIGLLFTISVVILTILKTCQSSREHKKLCIANNHNLAGLILTNGSLYFISLLSLNIVEILFYFYESAYLQDIASNISNVIGTILISRFILALRQMAVHPNGTTSVQLHHISSLHMAVNHLHSVIEEEFGDPLYHTSYKLRQAREAEDIVSKNLDEPHATVTITPPIDLEGFPWATGIEVVEVEREGVGSNPA